MASASSLVPLIGVLLYNVPAAVLAYATVYGVRRRDLRMTWGRGALVLVAGWLVGSLVELAFGSLFRFGGWDPGESSLEVIVAWVVLASVMYPLYAWLGSKRDVIG